MRLRAAGARREAPGQKERVTGEQMEMLVERQAEGEVQLLADVAPGLASGVKAEHAATRVFPRAAR